MKPLKITAVTLFSLSVVLAQTLHVDVTGLKNDQGVVQVSLYNKEGSIPDKTQKNYYKRLRVKIKNHQANATFKGLEKGRYAVSIYHDENNNGKIDKGLFLPKEGVGLSNYSSIDFFHLPDFTKASFLLDHDKTVTIKAIYI